MWYLNIFFIGLTVKGECPVFKYHIDIRCIHKQIIRAICKVPDPTHVITQAVYPALRGYSLIEVTLLQPSFHQNDCTLKYFFNSQIVVFWLLIYHMESLGCY